MKLDDNRHTGFKRPVILIGMPGSGKSTIGKSVADHCGIGFIDTDDLLVERLGTTLQDYINENGPDGFARVEEDFLKEFDPGSEPVVIATGGSAVLYPDAMLNLKDKGIVVFIDCDLPSLRKRLWNFESRGIVVAPGEDKAQSILDLYMTREPLYYKYCDVRIEQRGMSRRKMVDKLIKEVCSKEAENS